MLNTNIDKLIFKYGIQKLNTFTKYLSILTYHGLGQRGSLVENLVDEKTFTNQNVYITEKIDGSNGRIIFTTNNEGKIEDFLIGSREDFLYAKGDRIINSSLNMVKNLLPFAEQITAVSDVNTLKPNHIYGFYGEHFGGNCNGYKNYTKRNTLSYRIFDIFEMNIEDAEEILDMEIDRISTWREKGNHPFLPVEKMHEICKTFNLETVPYIKIVDGNTIPTDLQKTYEWIQEFKNTNVTLDSDYEGPGNSEGVVIRTADRKNIKKLRFEDYNKTKKMGLIK